VSRPESLPDRIRAFVAIRLVSKVEEALAELIEDLSRTGRGIRWVRPGNLHLTLRFLGGSVETQRLRPLLASLEKIAAETSPFTMKVGGVGGFPSLGRPRVIWAGLKSPELVELARRVEAAAVRHGFEPEERAFAPHLTIGRVHDPRGFSHVRRVVEEARDRKFGASRTESMTLYRSILSPAGANYDALAKFGFTR
jgi:2'-5' RNA ligase